MIVALWVYCLQKNIILDYFSNFIVINYVITCFKRRIIIEPRTRKIEYMHNLVMKQSARRVILSVTSDSDLGDDQEKCNVKDNPFLKE